MINQRWRPVFIALLAIFVIWAVAMTGFFIARNSRVTAEKVRAYVQSIELSKLSAAARAKALKDLADKLNALSMEERRQARMEQLTWSWFAEMSDAEKATFLEATMPTGFKQMLTSFEQLPEEKRRRAVDDALRRLKEARAQDPAVASSSGTNGAPVLSKELEAKVRSIGLQTFYSQSSAQTK